MIRSLIRELADRERSERQQLSVYDLAGIARSSADIPSDGEIEAWLDERRMKESSG